VLLIEGRFNLMKNFDTRAYSIADFIEWNTNGLLELSPEFQRRSVWALKAKSYLIDTIIRGKPIPKILIMQRLEKGRNVRIVVDGQQRLRSIFEFVAGDFKISRAHNDEYANKSFELLPADIREGFLKYELGVDLLFDMSYEDILDIFTRINAYTVSLNNQEKLNAKYLGYFKQYVYKYGLKYVRFFLDARILSEEKVTRMAEAELVSDLFVSLLDGIQSNKVVEKYYQKYEDEIGPLQEIAVRFDKVMSIIGTIYPPQEIKPTNWARIHLFYTLFTVMAHLHFSIKGPDKQYKLKLTGQRLGQVRVVLDEISSRYDEISQDLDIESHPKDFKQFITNSRRATTDTSTRISRTNFVCQKIMAGIN
jgi:hypothetical protein